MSRRPPSVAAILTLLGVLILFVWGPLLWAPFIYDDGVALLINPDMTGHWPGFRYWLTASFGGYHIFEPLNAMLHFALWRIAGGRPALYRLTSLALHWGNACLVFAFLRRRLKETHAVAAAVLFAIFPPTVEVLAVSTFKKHLLVAFFGLLLVTFVQPAARRLWACAAAGALLILALLTKESALAIPLLALAVEAADGPGFAARLKRSARYWLTQGVVVAGYLFYRLLLLPLTIRPLAGSTWPHHLLTSAKGFLWYCRMAVLPWPLCPESDLKPVLSVFSGEALMILLGVAAVAGLLLFVWRRDRVAGLGLLWFVVALAPFQNIPSALNLSPVADRYLYLASAGLLLSAARLSERFAWRRPVFGAIAVFWVWLSMSQAALYASPLDLWTRACECAPSNPRVHNGLGEALAGAGRLDEAARETETAFALAPNWYQPTVGLLLADIYARQGRLKEAAALAQREAQIAPNQRTLAEAGIFQLRLGDDAAAEPLLEKSLRLDPRDGDALLALAAVRQGQGHRADAEALLSSAAMLYPYRSRALADLGRLRLAQRRLPDAERFFKSALEADPLELSAVEGLADALGRQGRKGEGLRLFDSFLERLDAIDRKLGADAAAQIPRETLAATILTVRQAREEYAKAGPKK